MKARIVIGALTLSASALVGIAVHEGYRGEAYIPVKGDVPTIGFGTTENVKPGDRIEPVQALVMQALQTAGIEPKEVSGVGPERLACALAHVREGLGLY